MMADRYLSSWSVAYVVASTSSFQSLPLTSSGVGASALPKWALKNSRIFTEASLQHGS
jgi:hypothetical protein